MKENGSATAVWGSVSDQARRLGIECVMAEDDGVRIVVAEGLHAEVPLVIDTIASGIRSIAVAVGAGASVHVVVLVRPEVRDVSIVQTADVGERGMIHWHNVTLGAGEIRQSLVSRLVGAGARSVIDWVFHARGTERQRLSARNVFLERNGEGEITMKGVAEEQAHVACDGMIEIGLQGGGTDTFLAQDVLMLDPTARVDAVPGLEIKTNDVKASHSATVSRVSAEDLFYFASRGIDEREARRMYVRGFLGEIAERVPEQAREMLREAMGVKESA